jgi:hypothetical protein
VRGGAQPVARNAAAAAAELAVSTKIERTPMNRWIFVLVASRLVGAPVVPPNIIEDIKAGRALRELSLLGLPLLLKNRRR